MICVGGPDRVIAVGGKDYRFEDHPRFGPCPVALCGKSINATRERDLPPDHAFWRAVSRWYEEGKPLGADGRCVWTEAPDELADAVHVGGRNWVPRDSFDPSRMQACPGCLRCRRAA